MSNCDCHYRSRCNEIKDETCPHCSSSDSEQVRDWEKRLDDLSCGKSWEVCGQYHPEYHEDELKFFIKQVEQEAEKRGIEKAMKALDEVLISVHDNGQEQVQGKDLNVSTYHYLVFKKLKELGKEQEK